MNQGKENSRVHAHTHTHTHTHIEAGISVIEAGVSVIEAGVSVIVYVNLNQHYYTLKQNAKNAHGDDLIKTPPASVNVVRNEVSSL